MASLKIYGCMAYQKATNKIQTSIGIPGKITVRGCKIKVEKQSSSVKSDLKDGIL